MSTPFIPGLLVEGGSVSGKPVELGLNPLYDLETSFSTHRKVPHTPIFNVESGSLEVTGSVGRGLGDKSGELVK